MEDLKLSEITVSYSRGGREKYVIQDSQDASKAFRAIMQKDNIQIELQEYFYIILLNRANHVIGFHQLSKGGISGTVADIRLVFAIALKCVASGIMLCHNHPSSNLKASEADIRITKKFVEAGSILEIPVLDHIILSVDGYLSFSDEGLI